MDETVNLEEKTCVNCSAPVKGNFCGNCGQRANVKRITFKEGWNDFWARIYGFDGMFPRTLRDLTLRPGEASKTFLKGNRAKYYGPVGYFFLMITLLYLVASLLGVDLVEFLIHSGKAAQTTEVKPGSGLDQFMQVTFKKISDNMKLVSFVTILIQAFCARYLFFRKSGYNLVENMVLPLYVQGHIFWISVASIIGFSITGNFIPPFVLLGVSFVFSSYAYANFFSYQHPVKALLKGLGILITTQLIMMLLMLVVVIIMLVTNPEVFEMLRPANNR